MKKMARYRYTVDEAVNLIAEDDDLGDINASDLEDIESDDGDIEEADYISSSGEGQLVSLSVLYYSLVLRVKMSMNQPCVTRCCYWMKIYVSQTMKQK